MPDSTLQDKFDALLGSLRYSPDTKSIISDRLVEDQAKQDRALVVVTLIAGSKASEEKIRQLFGAKAR
jgi:hypothetical protein